MADATTRIANLSPPQAARLREKLGLKAAAGVAPSSPAPRPLQAAGEPVTLSYGQERLWFIDQLQPGSPAYNIPGTFPLFGPVDAALLQRCVEEIVRRHEILRTIFTTREGRPVQIVGAARPVLLPIVDLSTTALDACDTEMRRVVTAEIQRPFDLATGPLIRTTLLRLPAHPDQPTHLLLCVMHHIVSDAWSFGIFLRELSLLYDAFGAAQPSPLPELPIQYSDFAVSERQILDQQRLARLVAYWKERLKDAPPVLSLPTDRPRASARSDDGAVCTFTLPLEAANDLHALCERTRTTPFMATLAVFLLVLSRHARTRDLVVGTPTTNRRRSELEGLIGFFLNTLVLRSRISGDPAFSEFLSQVRDETLGAYAHQDLPFEMLVDALHPGRSLGVHPIFQVMFVMQTTHLGAPASGDAFDVASVASGKSRFDLTLSLVEAPGRIDGSIEYSSDLFDPGTIERLAEHYRVCLADAVANPDRRLSEISLLSADEEERLRRWNDTAQDIGAAACIHHLVERQAAAMPDATAIDFEGRSLSYLELNSRANRIAHHLRQMGVGPETFVGIFTERSIEMIVGLLGILKAGGAYLPLDPTYPASRIEFMLADTKVPVVLTHPPCRDRLPAFGGRVLDLVRDWGGIDGSPAHDPQSGVCGDHPAYVIYTSGSSGQPKGVVVPHRGVCNAGEVEHRLYRTAPDDRVLQFASLNFDASIFEIIMSLRGGSTLQLISADTARSGADLVRLLAERGVTIVALPPSALAALPVVPLPTVRMMIVMGEDCPGELVARWQHVPEFFNCYGPTEASMWMTGTFLHAGRAVTIGRPIANTRAHLLDEHLCPVPVGVPGELFVGGVCVTRGYLDRPALTAERFVPDPFSTKPGARLYRTGDLAACTAEGDIRFLGRLDLQVKIRGFRVELGEVEAALNQHPGVRAAVVTVRDDLPSGSGLVGYIVGEQDTPPSTSELRQFLLTRLPDHMIPAAFVTLDALPLNQAAKIDRQALPAPRWERPALDVSFLAPSTSVEQVIARIWSTLLGRDRVGVRDNFFELGGHSMLATQIIARTRDAFGIDLPIRAIFEHPTISELSALVEDRLGRVSPPEPPAVIGHESVASRPAPKRYALSFAQERLWFLRQLDPDDRSYNIPFELPLWNVDPDLLRQCFNTIVRRHEILRTTFHVEAHRPVQVVAPALEIDLPMIDLSGEPEQARRAEYQRIYALAASRRFDLENGPLVAATLVRLDRATYSLVIVADHVVFDGWSVGVLFRELAALYDASMRAMVSPLAALPIQYGEHAERQRTSLQGDLLKRHEDFWKAKLRGIPTRIELPLDRPRQNMAGNALGAFHFFDLPDDVAAKLRALAQSQQTTTFTVLLAAFQALLWRYTREDTIVVGSPVANREPSDIQALIGFFVNMLILRADFSNGITFRQLLGQVRETVIAAYEHQELPFEKLIEELQPERDPSINPIFQVMFALHHVGRTPDGATNPLAAGGHGAKFDLSLHVTDDQQAFKGTFEYRTALFESSTIERMAGHLVRLLGYVVEHLDAPLVDAVLPTPPEQEALRACHRTGTSYDTTTCVHDLFVAQAARTPHAVAVAFENRQLTYAELDRQSTHVATRLRALGVHDESLVGVCLERSPDFMAALLGVLKAGGVYVPLDPEYPDERLRLIIRDAALPMVFADEQVMDRLAGSGARLLRVADCVQDGEPTQPLPQVTAKARNAVYVIYTSGSTGTPKGAINTHEALTNRLLWMQDTYRLAPRDRVLHKTSIGFDVSVWELLWPIITGATLVLAAPRRQRDVGYLARLMASSAITHLHFVPSMLQTFLAESGPLALPQLRCVIASGEELSASLQQRFFERIGSCALENLYGPTEAAIDVTRWPCRLDPARRTVPIGHAIANTRLYVLDRNLNELPTGIAGELYIAGIASARGYLRRPALTAERFLPDPIGDTPGARMYRTGDLGRRLPGGEIEYLGRIDDQVKLRGARIELGEVRAALLRHPGVRDAVVVVDGNREASERRLIAYYLRRPDHEVEVSELRRSLHDTLPAFMVPSAYVEIAAIPLTQNGKLDRKALPKPDAGRVLTDAPVPPADPLQALIVSLWGEILRVDGVGIEDNFFDLGGHSLLAVQVLSRLRAALDVDVPAARFFNAPTPTLLAAEILRGVDDAATLQARAQTVMTVANLSDDEVTLMLRTLGDATPATEGAT
jgi:amino acid adenylation domain-containing protein